MNRHERRAAKTQRRQLDIGDELWGELWDLPLFQVTIARRGTRCDASAVPAAVVRFTSCVCN